MAPDESAVQTALPKVAILLCTYNGAGFLGEQLDSIEAQTHANWEVWASDDGSTDGTLALLRSRLGEWPAGRMHIVAGPQRGFAANFLSLACRPEIEADYFAFCDQDDVWEAEKLQRALDWISSVSADVPALYCARTRLIDAEGREIGLSPLFTREPGFGNALVQNIGGGNTMMLNKAALSLIQQAGPEIPVIAHDWWVYILISGCGGCIHYDVFPSIRYRQHQGNLIGQNSSLIARVKRAKMLLNGSFRSWIDLNLKALNSMERQLTPENIECLRRFCAVRGHCGVLATINLMRSGVYRQTVIGNLGMVMSGFFGRL